MHLVLSLLVGLSDKLIIVCVPAVAAAVLLGRHRESSSRSERVWQTAFRWGGRLGALLLAVCVFLFINRGFAGGVDRLDYGLLTGVPTLFVAAISAYSIATVLGLVGFALLPRGTGSARTPSANGRPSV
jgi:hypothetical protein